jgi:hypothetical protein
MDKIEKYYPYYAPGQTVLRQKRLTSYPVSLVFILGNCCAGITTAAATLLHDNLLLSHAEN